MLSFAGLVPGGGTRRGWRWTLAVWQDRGLRDGLGRNALRQGLSAASASSTWRDGAAASCGSGPRSPPRPNDSWAAYRPKSSGCTARWSRGARWLQDVLLRLPDRLSRPNLPGQAWRYEQLHRRRRPAVPVEAARARHRLAEVATRTGIPLGTTVGTVTVKCPMPSHGHPDRTPSMRLYLDDDRFYCFGCGAKGDVVQWVQDSEGVGTLTAVRRLEAGEGLHNAWAGPAAVSPSLSAPSSFPQRRQGATSLSPPGSPAGSSSPSSAGRPRHE